MTTPSARAGSTGGGELAAGARAMAPVLLGLVPAGVAVGAALAASAVPVGAGMLASATVYGASAQVAVIELSARGVSPVLVGAAVAVLSVRLALLGVGLGRRLCGAPARVRWLAALVLVDPAYLVADNGTGAGTTVGERQRFYLGAACTLWVGWQVAHAAGVVMGALIPRAWALDFALPLCLLGLVAPRLHDRAARSAALVAAVVAVTAGGAPLGTGLLLAVGAGLFVGTRAGARR